MVLFYLKKNFADGWENLLKLALFNVFFSLFAIGLYYLVGMIVTNELNATILIVLCIAVFSIPVFMVNEATAQMADFKSITIQETIQTFSAVYKDALLFSFLVSALLLLLTIGIPFYMAFENMLGIFLAALLFWVSSITTLSLQWFLAIRAQLKDPFLKALKKSFIVFFDNVGFSVFLFFYTIVLLALSALLAFLAPGLSGILLAQNNALRLRLYKYDWIEQHPDISPREARRSIPWDELLAEDREKMGPITLKNLIFPWK